MPQNLSTQFVCPSPKVCDFNEKRLHWASVVRGLIKIVRSICIVILRVNHRFGHMYCMDFQYRTLVSPEQPFYCLSLLLTFVLMYLRLEPLLGPYLGPYLGPDVSFWYINMFGTVFRTKAIVFVAILIHTINMFTFNQLIYILYTII